MSKIAVMEATVTYANTEAAKEGSTAVKFVEWVISHNIEQKEGYLLLTEKVE